LRLALTAAELEPAESVRRRRVLTDASGTQVFFDTARGLRGLVTCTGDAGGGFTITVRGFFTARS
jgi:hypothetical protein